MAVKKRLDRIRLYKLDATQYVKILRKTGSKRRLYQDYDEKIEHIISACPILTKEQYTVYIMRHDRVCAQIHASQESKVTILCNQQGKTDRNVHNDKTDFITRDNKRGVCVLIDIAVSGNKSVMKKEALSGHKSLAQVRLVEKNMRSGA